MIQRFNILVSEFLHVYSLQRQRNWYSAKHELSLTYWVTLGRQGAESVTSPV